MFRAATAFQRAIQRGASAGGARRGASDAAWTRSARGHSWGGYAIGAALVAGTSLYASQALRLEQQHAGKDLEVGGRLDPTKLGKEVKWVVMNGVVYDVTTFIDEHPGGPHEIYAHLGKDITPLFDLLHPKGTFAKAAPRLNALGASSVIVEIASTGEVEAAERRLLAPALESVNTLVAFKELAHAVLGDSETFMYYSGYADSGASLESNASSFSFVRFLPRIGIHIAPTSTETTFLSIPTSLPIYFCPTAQMRGGHPLGELNHTRAAAHCDVHQGLSNVSSVSIPEIGEERKRILEEGGKPAPLWWQLYLKSDRKASEDDLKAAVKAGATAILFTFDTPVLGKRVNGHITRTDTPPGVTVSQSSNEINLKWSDIEWIKSIVPGVPVLVKGVGCAADVQIAKEQGADGVIISNHGGRQLDYTSPPLATLVRTKQAFPELLKDPHFEVYLEGGITRGTDVLKALCLGARGVGIGRPIIYAQTVYGEDGIIKAVDILREEIEIGMKLLGAQKLSDLKPEMVELMGGLLGEQQ